MQRLKVVGGKEVRFGRTLFASLVGSNNNVKICVRVANFRQFSQRCFNITLDFLGSMKADKN